MSLVSESEGRQLRPYVSHVGVAVELLEFGNVAANVMFERASADNSVATCLLRSAFWFSSFVGFTLLAPVLHLLAHKIPWLPMVVPADSSPMEFSVYMWLLAILLGWILSRPALAITAALASLVPLFVARTLDFDA